MIFFVIFLATVVIGFAIMHMCDIIEPTICPYVIVLCVLMILDLYTMFKP